jgi:hypothetical protein
VIESGAKLLVIDPLMASVPLKHDTNNDQHVRVLLARISRLAEETGCAVLLVRHLNKKPGGSPLYRGGGSIGIVGVARSGMLVAPLPEDPDDEVRVLAMTKCNLARRAQSLMYEVAEAVEPNRFSSGVPRVHWQGESDLTAAELLSPPRTSPERKDVLDLLARADEPMDAAEIAAALGEEKATVAKRLLRMAEDGQIGRASTGRYTLPRHKREMFTVAGPGRTLTIEKDAVIPTVQDVQPV